MEKVAIVGAGPGGLVAARWLEHEGFEPVLFEQGDSVGGQWTGDPRYSGVWPSMRTNTTRVMTAFSDLPHEAGVGVYPTNQAVRAYLSRYAERFDLPRRVRLKTTVRKIDRDPQGAGWRVGFTRDAGQSGEEIYRRVVVAIGRHNSPVIPAVPGLESFSGSGGVAHTFAYKHPERYREQRVLVAGCSISALEVASDIAMLGAARVVVSNRRQRYILPKLCAGVPADHVAFTRFGGLAMQCMPRDVVAARIKEFIMRVAGSPAQAGAPAPDDNVLDAKVALSQHFLPLVAEGRIEVRPWLAAVEGAGVRFGDGSAEEFDAIVFGTGYALRLPFLPEDVLRTLAIDGPYIELHKATFHPNLPGLAFVGVRQTVGPNYPVLELQSRWIAYVWSGTRPAPSADEMRAGLAASRAQRSGPADAPMHVVALEFADGAGVEPNLERRPELARALMFGPLSPASFRLDGPDALPDAAESTRAAAAAFEAVATPKLTPAECAQLKALAAVRGDPAFLRFVDRITSPVADQVGSPAVPA